MDLNIGQEMETSELVLVSCSMHQLLMQRIRRAVVCNIVKCRYYQNITLFTSTRISCKTVFFAENLKYAKWLKLMLYATCGKACISNSISRSLVPLQGRSDGLDIYV